MASRRLLLLAILLFGSGLSGSSRNRKRDIYTFQFTSSIYNVSLEENARGKDVYAISNEPIRMGVPLPSDDAVVKFRIVEGDKQYFKAETKAVGDFAFLRIRHRNDGILNRELKDRYEFLIKASCRRKDATNLETTAMVNLFVMDQNDAKPIFEKDEYRADVKQDAPPFTNILQVQASDADIALNSQIYYSLVDSSLDFTVDPISGAIRNLRPLEPGTYELLLLAEDRASRLFRKKFQTDYDNDLFNYNKAKAVVTVESVGKGERKIKAEVKSISASLWNSSQIVAVVRIGGTTTVMGNVDSGLEIVDGEHAGAFVLKKDTNADDTWIIETIPGIRPKSDWVVQLKAFTVDDFTEDLVENISLQVVDRRSVQFENPAEGSQFFVNESAPPGFTVTQLKARTLNGFGDDDDEQIRYSIISSNESLPPFSIDENSGHLRTTEWLDYENTSSYRFEISAELPNYGLQTTKAVEVIVVDSNDHSPVFAAKWARGDPIAFPRNYQPNKVLLRAEALDLDSGPNGHVRYELRGEDPGTMKIFTVNSETGDIMLRQKPSEKETRWRLKIRASDAGWPFPRSSEVLISVYVNGTNPPPKIWPSLLREPGNEQSPVFAEQPVFNISADAPPGKVLGSVKAHDGDAGYAGVVRFSTMDKFFAVKPFTGEISVLGPLIDLFGGKNKTEAKEHNVDIRACDWGEPVKCTNGTVKILVSKANLHKPQFEKPYYRVHLAEDAAIGYSFLVLTAQDDDYGDNGRVGYRIVGTHSYFEIDENTGVLQVRKKLDREIKASHRFTVMAFDHGDPMKVTFVNVTVILADVNDNAPMCARTVNKIVIPEDYPNNALVTCIVASDPDEGKNGEIAYAFDSAIEASATLPFRIQEDTGCVFVNTDEPFDFETTKLYNLSIEAVDNGEPMLSSICTLLVELSDVNENLFPPLFDDIAHVTTVYENMPIWTEVLALNAVDPDDPRMPVKYVIIDGDGIGLFSIDSEGILRTSVVLDREASDSYWVTVEASDLAPIPRTSILHVFVRVLDRNDHVPFSTHPVYFSTIPENSPEDTVVVKVEAQDKDDHPNRYGSANVRYRIISGDPQSFFAVDSKTGYVVTRGKRRLDREAQKDHTVLVELCDQGDPKLCTTVSVIITVTDLNDNPPIFKQAIYSFNVPAGKIGEMCRIFAADADEGENAHLFYNLTKSDSQFSIDSDGRISTSEPLKVNEAYHLILKASDMGRPQQTSSSVSVTLNAIERQAKITTNGKPKLLNEDRWMRLAISDVDSVGETIGLIEAEDPDGDQLWWNLTEGNPNNTFAVRCDAGELYLAKSLDFIAKNINEVHLKFTVSDGLDSVEGMVVVEISRAHRKRPEFTAQHYKIRVSRVAPVGAVLHTLKATVEKPNGLIIDRGIIFGIHLVEDVAAADKLRVDPSSGDVVVVEAFNDTVTSEFTAVVYARFNQMFNYALLSISLYDERRKPPKFVISEYSISIPSSSPTGTKILTVRAYDQVHSVIAYSISDGNGDGYFAIDRSSGAIQVATPLISYDRGETVLTIQATTQHDDHLTDQCTVHINVLNDDFGRVNFPQSSYTLTVYESTPPNTVIYTLDTESITGIRYAFRDPCPYLAIHPISGALSTKLIISATPPVPITCFVIGRSSLGAEDLLELRINIVSENRHTPFFNKSIYEGYILENMSPGSPVLLEGGSPLVVKAIDHDRGINGLVSYRVLSPLEPYFTVDYLSGAVLTKAEIDFEKIKHRSFYIQASDFGSVVLTSPVPALVQVTVHDVNDVPPTFIQKQYQATLLLPTLKGSTISEVSAKDADTVGVLRFAITESDDSKLFAVEAFTGRIYSNANSSADYTRSFYKINLVVSDGVKSDFAELSVHVENTSRIESAIKFSRSNYEASIPENATSAVPLPILPVSAKSTSGDAGILYRLLNPNDYFVIDARSGIISWTGVLIDRERTPAVQFIVQAHQSNGGNKAAQSIVSIKIQDVNDCEPHFLGLPYEITIPRDVKLGDKVVSVKAIDADEGYNGVVRYKLKTGTDYFNVNKYDGQIAIKKSLADVDFDTISLEVIAEDQGMPSLSSTTYVTIHVVDSKIPIFDSGYQQAHILENAALGSSVLKVHAVSNVEGRIGYMITHGSDEHFKIDFDSGVISVRKALDLEKCAFYNLTVVAVDVTRPGVRAKCFVAINVDDVSDSAPRFTQLVYDISVSESTPIGTQLLKVEAVDPDVGDNYIAYGITGPDASVLSIDSESGVISLTRPLDFETKRLYKFKLAASDSLQLTSEADLLLRVTDVNDIAPRFISKSVHSIVENGTPAKNFVAKLDASDVDTVSDVPGGDRFLFSIIDGDETLMQINHSTGVVSLLRAVAEDDTEIGEKRFNITVSDGIFTDFCLLIVKIIRSRREQQLPRFERTRYSANLRENGPAGMTLLNVQALGGVSPLRYSFHGNGNSSAGTLNINEATGKISTRSPFDYEVQRTHQYVIMVTDADGQRAFATLNLDILDENDNVPKFIVPSIEISVSVSSQPGESVLTVFAVDDDANDELEYTIVGGDESRSNYFAIHPKQGVISVQKPLHELVGEQISLFVRVTDAANPPHHSEASVVMEVIPASIRLPKFSSQHYLFSVAENVPIGTVVGRVQQDSQQEIPNAIFLLVDEMDRSSDFLFSVKKNSGEIIVNSALNYKKGREIRSFVRLQSEEQHGAKTVSLVTVRITDMNNTKLHFENTHERIVIAEDSPIGSSITVVKAMVADAAGPNSKIHYFLEEGISNGTFKMDRETGYLTLAKKLDREVVGEYRLAVIARGGGGQSVRKTVTVVLKDVNDSPPQFTQKSYFVEYYVEELTMRQKILQFEVHDSDLHPNNVSKLYIISGNEYDLFRLDADILVLHQHPKNFDTVESHLLILAHDGKYATTAEVTVKLLSNNPEFRCEPNEILKNITEDSKAGTVIFSEHQKVPKLLRFYLTGPEADLFDVDGTGTVVVRGNLSSHNFSQFELYLRAEGPESLCIRPLIINFESTNKHEPAFKQPIFYGSIQENTNATKQERVYAARVEANIGDMDGIGRVTFQFASDIDEQYLKLFDLNPETGVITALSALDREAKDQYELPVLVVNAAGYTAKAKVVIDVADVNDNAPIFEQNAYHLRIAEDEEPGRELLHLKAYGGDDKEFVRYQIRASEDVVKYVSIGAESGILKLASALDFEQLEKFSVTVIATDSGTPPLNSTCLVEIEVLDVNDNPPQFTKQLYKAAVLENMQPGTKVVQVLANDADSEHFGRVSYLITNDATAFAVGEDGWITTVEELDRELKSSHRLTVKAMDGGTPPLTDSTVVVIDVEDQNDNAPVFKHCNLTAVVQESVEPGHIILPISITDNDVEPNTGPYKLEIAGDGASSFAFDSAMNLITTKRLTAHTKKEVYLLSVIVSDRGGLFTECPLTIFVKEESRHAPQTKPLKVILNTLMGEFLGGKVGTVMATDQDAADMLRYSLADREPSADIVWSGGQRLRIPFTVDSETGDIIGEADPLAGSYRFNVSVTDGKFITTAPVSVDVTSIDQDALDHSVSIRIHNLLGETFLSKHARNFVHSLSKLLNVKPQNVQILSIQSAPARQHHLHVRHLSSRLSSERDLDILFTVSRTDSRGYHRPSFIRQSLEENVAEFSDDIGAEIISVITEICRRDVCVNGECQDRLYLDDTQTVYYMTDQGSFSSPRHLRTYECTCRVGYGGKRCDTPIDKCSRDQCTKEEMCVPMNTNIGFECVCPPGTTGDRCAATTCGKDKRECSQSAEIGVGGDGFFQMTVTNSMERRLELTINFKTRSTDAVIMHAAGKSDFHSIEIDKRYVQYRWNCGTGVGVARAAQQIVSDGKWHTLKISRRSRHAKLVLDEIHEAEGDSPSGSDVLNLYREATRLTFGALVSQLVGDVSFSAASDLKPMVTRGMVGCFGRISVDGYEVPKTKQGLYLYNTRLNCNTVGNVPCAASPCGNEGTCIPSGEKSYSCVCPPRYSGSNCETDLTPCLSRPCPPGVDCINLHSDFYCRCPPGFTGKTCQLRGEWDPCLPNPCGQFGSCIHLPQSAGFICNCSHGYSGTACKDRSPDLIGDGRPLNTIKVIGFIIVVLLIMIVTALIAFIILRIKKSRTQSKAKEMEYETNNFNPRVSMQFDSAPRTVAPPPLPPRGFRLHNSQLSNYQKGLPTVQVHPFPTHERISSSSVGGGSRSPSLAGSGRCRIRRSAAPGSARSADSKRSNGSCDEAEPLAGAEALRRYGELIIEDDDGMASCSSSQLQPAAAAADRYHRSSGSKHRIKRSRNVRSSDERPSREDWRAQCDKRINGACDAAAELRSERSKNNPGARRRNAANESSVSMQDDDDYMTMRPAHRRVIPQSAGSQRRPLLETSDSDGMESSDFSYPDELKTSQRRKPLPPAHNIRKKNKTAVTAALSNRVYDEPAAEGNGPSRQLTKKRHSASEMMRPERFENFCNIDDSDGDTATVNGSTSSNVHQTMAVL